MVSLFLFHDDDQKEQVTKLLEEFADKVHDRGITMKLSEFDLSAQSEKFLSLS